MSEEEWVMGGSEDEGGAFSHHSSPITHHATGRIRWDCRRGMLELDIILARFMEQNFERLTQQEVEVFKGLLAYPDPDLLALIQDSSSGAGDEVSAVLQLLRRS